MSRRGLSGLIKNEQPVQVTKNHASERMHSAEQPETCHSPAHAELPQAFSCHPQSSLQGRLPPDSRPYPSRRHTRQHPQPPKAEPDRHQQCRQERACSETISSVADLSPGLRLSSADDDARGPVPPLCFAVTAPVVDTPPSAAPSENEVVLLSAYSGSGHDGQPPPACSGFQCPAFPRHRERCGRTPRFQHHYSFRDQSKGDCAAREVLQSSQRKPRTSSCTVSKQSGNAVNIKSRLATSKRSSSGFNKSTERFIRTQSEFLEREVPDVCAAESPGLLDQQQSKAEAADSEGMPPSALQGPERSTVSCPVSRQNQGNGVDAPSVSSHERSKERTDPHIQSQNASSDQTTRNRSRRESSRESSAPTTKYCPLKSRGGRETGGSVRQFTESVQSLEGTKEDKADCSSENQDTAGNTGKRTKNSRRNLRKCKRRKGSSTSKVHAKSQPTVHPRKQGQPQSALSDSHLHTHPFATSIPIAAAPSAQTPVSSTQPAVPGSARQARTKRKEGRIWEINIPAACQERQGGAEDRDTGRERHHRSIRKGKCGEERERSVTSEVKALPLSAPSPRYPALDMSVASKAICASPAERVRDPDFTPALEKVKNTDFTSASEKVKDPDFTSALEKVKDPDFTSALEKVKDPGSTSPTEKVEDLDCSLPLEKGKHVDDTSPMNRVSDRDCTSPVEKGKNADSVSPMDKVKNPEDTSLMDKDKDEARCLGCPAVQIKVEAPDDEYSPVGHTDIKDLAKQPTTLKTSHPKRSRYGLRDRRRCGHAEKSSQNTDSGREWSILFETALPASSHSSGSFDINSDNCTKEDDNIKIKIDVDNDVKETSREIRDTVQKDTMGHTDMTKKGNHDSKYCQLEDTAAEVELMVIKKDLNEAEENETESRMEPVPESTAEFSDVCQSPQAIQPACQSNTDGATMSKDQQRRGRRKQKNPRQCVPILQFEGFDKNESMQTDGDDTDNVEQSSGLTNCLTVLDYNADIRHHPSQDLHASQSCLPQLTEAKKLKLPLTDLQDKWFTDTRGTEKEHSPGKILASQKKRTTQSLQLFGNSTSGFNTVSNISRDRNSGSGSDRVRKSSIKKFRSFEQESSAGRSQIPPVDLLGIPAKQSKAAGKAKLLERSHLSSVQRVVSNSSVLSVPGTPLTTMTFPYVPLDLPSIPAFPTPVSMHQNSASSCKPVTSTAGPPSVPKIGHHPTYVPIFPKVPIMMPAVATTLPLWDTSQTTGAVPSSEAPFIGYHGVPAACTPTASIIPVLSGQHNQLGEANRLAIQGESTQLGMVGRQISSCTGCIPVFILVQNTGQHLAATRMQTQTNSGPIGTAVPSSSKDSSPDRTVTAENKVLTQNICEGEEVVEKLDKRNEKKSNDVDESIIVEYSNEESKLPPFIFSSTNTESWTKLNTSNIPERSQVTSTRAATSSKESGTGKSASASSNSSEEGKEMDGESGSGHEGPVTSIEDSSNSPSWYFPFQYDAGKRAEDIVFSTTFSSSQQTGGNLGPVPPGHGGHADTAANTVSGEESESAGLTTSATASLQGTAPAGELVTATSGHKDPAEHTDDVQDCISGHLPSQHATCEKLEVMVSSTTSSVPAEQDIKGTSPDTSGCMGTDLSLQNEVVNVPSKSVPVKGCKPAGVSKSGRKRFASTKYDFQPAADLLDASDKDITPDTSDDEWTPDKDQEGKSSHTSEEEGKQAKTRRWDSILDLFPFVKRRKIKVKRSSQAGQKTCRNRPRSPKSQRAAAFHGSPAPTQSEQAPTRKAKPDIRKYHKADPGQELSAENELGKNIAADHDGGEEEKEDEQSGAKAVSTVTVPVADQTPLQKKRRTTPYTKEELTCRMCSKSFINIYRLRRHEFSHGDERPYVCDLCGKAFKQSGHRNEHRQTHSANKRSFLCNECGLVITSRSSFRYHLLSHKQLLPGTSTAISSEITEPQDDSDSCSPGGVRSEAPAPHCPEEAASAPGVPSVGTKGGVEVECSVAAAAYDCPHCTLRFATAQGLNCHLESHQEVELRCHVQPFTCRECGRSFTYHHNLRKHRECHAKPEKRAELYRRKVQAAIAAGQPHFMCDTCGKVYLRKETLTKHLKTHLGLKPFQCRQCLKRFTQKSHLTVHSRLHTGSRPFQCRTCHCCFLDSTALARHIMRDVCKVEGFSFNVGKRGRKPFHSIMDEKVKAIVRSNREQRQRKSPASLKCSLCSWTGRYDGFLQRHMHRQHPADAQKALKRTPVTGADHQ